MRYLIVTLVVFLSIPANAQDVILRVNYSAPNSYEFLYFFDSSDYSKIDSLLQVRNVTDIVIVIDDISTYLIGCFDPERPFFLCNYSDSTLVLEDYKASNLLEYSLTQKSKK